MIEPWNSLEIVKLVASLFTTLLITFFGFLINRNIMNLDKKNKVNDKILEKRLQIYENIVPKLNDILCFHAYIGDWRDLTPIDIIKYKKSIGKELYMYSPLFTPKLIETYRDFISLCYEKSTDVSTKSKIKSSYKAREDNALWKSEYVSLFSQSYLDSGKDINEQEFGIVNISSVSKYPEFI